MIKMEMKPPIMVHDMSPQDQERYLVLLAQLKKIIQEGFRIVAIMAVIGLFCVYKVFAVDSLMEIGIYCCISWLLMIVSNYHLKKLRLQRQPVIDELDEIIAKYEPIPPKR